jgi:hypothetical protein
VTLIGSERNYYQIKKHETETTHQEYPDLRRKAKKLFFLLYQNSLQEYEKKLKRTQNWLKTKNLTSQDIPLNHSQWYTRFQGEMVKKVLQQKLQLSQLSSTEFERFSHIYHSDNTQWGLENNQIHSIPEGDSFSIPFEYYENIQKVPKMPIWVCRAPKYGRDFLGIINSSTKEVSCAQIETGQFLDASFIDPDKLFILTRYKAKMFLNYLEQTAYTVGKRTTILWEWANATAVDTKDLDISWRFHYPTGLLLRYTAENEVVRVDIDKLIIDGNKQLSIEPSHSIQFTPADFDDGKNTGLKKVKFNPTATRAFAIRSNGYYAVKDEKNNLLFCRKYSDYFPNPALEVLETVFCITDSLDPKVICIGDMISGNILQKFYFSAPITCLTYTPHEVHAFFQSIGTIYTFSDKHIREFYEKFPSLKLFNDLFSHIPEKLNCNMNN